MSNIENNSFMLDALLFVTIIDCKSFTAAGDKLGISKSVVSKRIKRLEEHLNLQLMHRSTRKLALTEAGHQLYTQLTQLKSQVENIETTIRKHQEAPSGTVRIHAPVSFGSQHLASAIADFSEIYPEIHIDMFLCQHFEDLIEQQIDLSIQMGPLKDSNFIAKKLMRSKLIVCASPKYLEKHGYPKTPDDLLKHNCLCYHHPNACNPWFFKDEHKNYAIEVSGNFCAASTHTLTAAAVAGQGIIMLPEFAVLDYIQSGRLVRLLKGTSASHIDIHALYTSKAHLAPKVRVLLDFLSERFNNPCSSTLT